MTVRDLTDIFDLCPDEAEIIIDKGYEMKGIAKTKLEIGWTEDTQTSRVILTLE